MLPLHPVPTDQVEGNRNEHVGEDDQRNTNERVCHGASALLRGFFVAGRGDVLVPTNDDKHNRNRSGDSKHDADDVGDKLDRCLGSSEPSPNKFGVSTADLVETTLKTLSTH